MSGDACVSSYGVRLSLASTYALSSSVTPLPYEYMQLQSPFSLL